MLQRAMTVKMLRGISYTAKIRLRHWIFLLWSIRTKLFGASLGLVIFVRIFLFFWFITLPPAEPSFICSFGKGRLGNQMSSLATMYSFARRHGLHPVVTEEQFGQLEFYFEIKNLALTVLERDLRQFYVSIFGFKFSRIWWEVPWTAIDSVENNFNYSEIAKHEHSRGKALNIGNYPNEIKYYKDFLPELRERIVLKERFVRKAEQKMKEELERRRTVNSNVTWVGIHNRRGDYGEHLKSLYGLSLLSANYFKRAMTYFTNHFSNVIFVVVTDDMEWAKENIDFPAMQVAFLGHDSVLEKDIANPLATADDIGDDLALLAACNHTILSYGTFGQWAAFLSGGEVVISTTAAHTKEGRELREGGFGWGTAEKRGSGNPWVWIKGDEKTEVMESVSSNGTYLESAFLLMAAAVLLQNDQENI